MLAGGYATKPKYARDKTAVKTTVKITVKSRIP